MFDTIMGHPKITEYDNKREIIIKNIKLHD